MTDTDDAPLWAEVCGIVFVLGYVLRWTIHTFAAGEFRDDIDWPARAVTLQSPAAEIRDTHIEVLATAVSAIAGTLLWLTTPFPAADVSGSIVFAWLTLQSLVLLGDPVVLAIARH